MGIGERLALGAQPVEVGRGDLPALGVQAVDVAIAEVICQNVEQVWL